MRNPHAQYRQNNRRYSRREETVAEQLDERRSPHDLCAQHRRGPAVEHEVARLRKEEGCLYIREIIDQPHLHKRPRRQNRSERDEAAQQTVPAIGPGRSRLALRVAQLVFGGDQAMLLDEISTSTSRTYGL